MPRYRSLKSAAIEVAMFVAMVAMVGHLSVSFWEQFIMHSELTKIHSSLNVLKDTLYIIECAYENLQKDITDLSEIAEQNPEILKPPKTNNQGHSYNKNIYQGYQVQAVSKPNAEKNVHAAPVTVDEATSNHKPYQAGKVNKNTTLATILYADADTLAPDEDIFKKYYQELRAKDHQNNRDFIYVIDKKDRDRLIPIRYRNTEDVGTITRYPLKSVGIGKSEDKLRGTSTHNQIQKVDNRLHKCYKERDEFRFIRPINDPSRWKF